MRNTVGILKAEEQIYDDFPDDISTLYGNGFNKCGERIHYITDSAGNGRTEPEKNVFDYLRFTKYPNGDPSKP